LSALDPDECPPIAETVAQLDEDFTEWLARLRHSEVAELRLYQGVGYVRINGVLRDTVPAEGEALRRVLLSIEGIDSAIMKGRLERPVCVYRGIRDSLAVFGVNSLEELLNEVARDPGYMSTTVDSTVALGMVEPRDGAAIVKLHVPAGQHAAWLPMAGQPSRRRELELLLARRSAFRVEEIATLGGLPMIRGAMVT
jgi:ADP-ribosyltransferase exoenzyme